MTGRKALEIVELACLPPDSIPGAPPAAWEMALRPPPNPCPGIFLPTPQAGAGAAGWCGRRRVKRVAPRRGWLRAGPGRGAVLLAPEVVRAGAGRVRPPGVVGCGAFLMCHQHVEPAWAVRASGTPPTFEGSRHLAPVPAAPGLSFLGQGRRRPLGPGQVQRGSGSQRARRGERRGAGPGSQ